jgi:organic hydroperoxide reductase OsmC/OhrA
MLALRDCADKPQKTAILAASDQRQEIVFMQQLPHRYSVHASAEAESNVTLTAEGLPQIVTAPPAEFGGPGDLWSPETLLGSAVADCFVLTSRAIARASKLEWNALECTAEGVLDRVDRVTRFASVTERATLRVPADTDTAKAQRLMEKSEAACLITRSLLADTHLETEILLDS